MLVETPRQYALEDERLLEQRLNYASQLYARADNLERQAAWVEANAALVPDNDRDEWDETSHDFVTRQRQRAGELMATAMEIEAQAYARLRESHKVHDAHCRATILDDVGLVSVGRDGFGAAR